MRLYEWKVTKDSGAGCGGAKKPVAAGKCATTLVAKGVNSRLPSEHGGGWTFDKDAQGNRFMTQEGKNTYLRYDGKLGNDDFTSTMRLSISKLGKSAATCVRRPRCRPLAAAVEAPAVPRTAARGGAPLDCACGARALG